MSNSEEIPQKPSIDAELYRSARDHEPNLVWHYAVKVWFRRAETSLLFGPSNCGKSALVGHLGFCITSGKPFFGARVKKGIVVHVGAEAPDSTLDRMQAFDVNNISHSEYIVRMHGVDLSNNKEVTKFIGDLKKISAKFSEKISLVVFDTLARSIGVADENCSGQMTAVVNEAERIARTMKVHVMLVHHTGKDVDRGGRGSSALRGAVDTEVCLAPEKDGSVRMTQCKQRTMQKLGPVFFGIDGHVLGKDEDSEDRTTVKAIELDRSPEGKAPTASSGGAGADRRIAVLTALHVRGMMGAIAAQPFKTRDVVKTLPSEVFKGVSDENRSRTVNRILADLAKAPQPVIEGERGEWRLARISL